MSEATTRSDHGERIARLEQIAEDTRRSLDRIAEDTRRSLDRIEAGLLRLGERIDKMGERSEERIDKLGDRQDQHFCWMVGLFVTLALATAGGFTTLYQLISRLPHG